MSAVKTFLILCLVIGLLVALLPHIIWLVGYLVSLLAGRRLSYAPFGWTALGLVVACYILMAYGFSVGRFLVEVNEVEYENSDIPESFNGFKIVQISDLHLSTFSDHPDKLDEFVDLVNAQSPDLICFTGDLVSVGKREAQPYTETLTRLHATHGVVSVLGNHDYMLYDPSLKTPESQAAALDELVDYETDTLRWRLLRNESFKIYAVDSTYVTILGVDNTNVTDQGFRTVNCGDLGKAMEGTDGFRILLTHDPSHWDAEVAGQTDIQLTLSGHTHAAQLEFFGWSPASLVFKRVQGAYEEGGQTLYVNKGLGGTAPLRIGARPEITVFTLVN